MAKKKMTTKEKQSERQKKQGALKKNSKDLQISALSMIDNMVFSKSNVMAYYRISNETFDFLNNDQRISLALGTSSALNNLMANRQDPLDGHLLQTSIPFDVDAWAQQMLKISQTWTPGPGFEKFMQDEYEHMSDEAYMMKVSYIGIDLGKRGALDFSGLNFFTEGIKGAWNTVKQWVDLMAQAPTNFVSAQEEASYRRREKDFYTTLATGNFQAQRATSEELLLLIKRQFHPVPMPVPYLNVDPDNRLGPGDLEMETISVIENNWKHLKITQMIGHEEMSGYRATLSFSKFPDNMLFPQQASPFFLIPIGLGIPLTLYSRFTLLPTSKMKKEVEKKRKEQEDEFENIMGSKTGGYDTVVNAYPSDFSQAVQDIAQISDIMASDQTAWVEGSYRLVVEAPDEETLKIFVSSLQQVYENHGINLIWTSGDQKQLFLEQMPGDKHRVKSFKQVTNLHMLGACGFNFSSDIGDPTFGDPTTAQTV